MRVYDNPTVFTEILLGIYDVLSFEKHSYHCDVDVMPDLKVRKCRTPLGRA